MNLAPEARAAAVGLFTEYRETTFVCGRRSVAAQAKRIAGDLLTKYRELHELTDAAAIPVRHLDMNLVNPDLLSVNGELNGVIRNHLRRWLGVTTGVVTEAEIADCLGQLIITMSSPDLYQIDAHLTGLAFDIHPPRHPTDAIERFIRQLNGLHASDGLRKETNHGEPRWHIQFGETSMASKDRPAPTS